jgi:1-acyl-sn-glycerol-3-phosphate acyltransferase
MVDLEYLKKIKLDSRPPGQRIVARLLLAPNYHFFSNVHIRLENIKNIPQGETVILAMNHTDRYNYWPLQYKLWSMKCFPFTTAWVKGKYYRNATIGKFMDWCNMIPVPSMGYLVEEFYRMHLKKRIDGVQYRAIKDRIDGKDRETESTPALSEESSRIFTDQFIEYLKRTHEEIMEKVAELSRKALFEQKLNLIIFPEGTRSTTLGEGRTGVAQLALHTEKKIIPIGCNNSEALYSGNLPFARSGTVTYRVGEPLSVENQLAAYRIREPFRLFSKESQKRFGENFERVTDIVMESIRKLLDEKYH